MESGAEGYRFDEFALSPSERRLARRGVEVVLRPKAFDTLLFLVRRHGHAVSKQALLDAVWPETNVSEAVLTHCIAEVRNALADDARKPRFVKTLSRHGYRFIAAVQVSGIPAEGKTATPPAGMRRTSSAPCTIVVLPFANLSADADNEYFCDGLSEELINTLTKAPGLQVVAHSSSFAFKGRDVDVREIGRALGASAILEGSVRREGSRVRVSAQLIDAASGCHLWCDQYDRRIEDVFDIQGEVAGAILAGLQVEFLKDGAAPPVRPATANMEAYQLYLRGRAFWHQRFDGGLQRAMDCFGQAIARDPGFAPPYSGLADCLSTLGIWGFSAASDVFPKAAALADTAARLNPALAEAHASRGLVRLFWDWDWVQAERDFEEALRLNPGCALIRLWYGHYLSIVGRMEQAVAEVKRAQALDPLSAVCSANVGWTLHLAHRQERAIAELRRVLERDPANAIALFYLGFALIEVDRPTEALDALGQAQAVTGGMPWAAEGIGLAHGRLGRPDLALATLADARERSTTVHVPVSAIALIHLGLDDEGAVLDCLERGVEEHDVLLPWLGTMPAFDRLHGQPRFTRILQRIGLADQLEGVMVGDRDAAAAR